MEEDKCAAFFKNKMEEVSRSALLEGTIDDFIDEQENKNTRAKTDGKVSLLKSFLQRKINSGTLKKHLLLKTKKLLTEFVFTVRSKNEWKWPGTPHHVRGKHFASGPVKLMNIKGKLFHNNYVVRTTVFCFFF